MATGSQDLPIDNVAAPGINRFFPSEFGGDINISKAAAPSVFAHKTNMAKQIKEVTAANPDSTYTFLCCGPVLNWGLVAGTVLGLSNHRAGFFDGGDVKFPTTRLETIVHATVDVLQHLDETEIRHVSP